ncbi:DNA-binding protein HU [Candidatus Phytoplasma luffae]|uniref:DNA-binding protein HU n=1 Tax=Loofah witches'-broom phytoplasma TaxID=35773 RepID=A0A975IM51_LOWBP|nr:HU family DNA-binding protein [Candidatus Phytoplasma luffae]QTX02749.1 DNA-binding protein HU [Candidatus Phytoplasma luffae]
MNKLELITKLSKELDMKKVKVEEFFDCLNRVVVENLKEQQLADPQSKNKKVIFGNLGAVHLKFKKERVFKVPKSNKVVTIPSRFVPVFKIGKKFIDLFTE